MHISISCQSTVRKGSNTAFLRKETLSPKIKKAIPGRRRAFFLAPLKAALTVEAAVVLPVFVLCMAACMQFIQVMETAGKFGSALCETAQELAAAAYAADDEEGPGVLAAGLSAVYAQSQVLGKAGNPGNVKNVNFLLASFLKEEQMVDLVMTYQVKTVVGGVKIPGVFFLQRGSVRAWTGRAGSDGTSGNAGQDGTGVKVYVTEFGTVYHRDLQCSHIKLAIRPVSASQVDSLRNTYGAGYDPCEKCGDKAGSRVYITSDGNKYHSTLECSGLKRTIKEVDLEEVSHMRACSRCGQTVG